MLLAHGVGTRADLPLPTTLVVVGAGLALVISLSCWRRCGGGRGSPGGEGGRSLPEGLQRVLDAPALRVAIPTIALVQISGIVTGHLMAAVSAHERAVQLFPPRRRPVGSVSLAGGMVGLTMGAVGLVFAG